MPKWYFRESMACFWPSFAIRPSNEGHSSFPFYGWRHGSRRGWSLIIFTVQSFVSPRKGILSIFISSVCPPFLLWIGLWGWCPIIPLCVSACLCVCVSVRLYVCVSVFVFVSLMQWLEILLDHLLLDCHIDCYLHCVSKKKAHPFVHVPYTVDA
jgi:hypothetical protein